MALAPMYDVTDAAFGRLLPSMASLMFFGLNLFSAEGLNHPEGRKRLIHQLQFSAAEKPIVAQIFGSHPEAFAPTAELLTKSILTA